MIDRVGRRFWREVQRTSLPTPGDRHSPRRLTARASNGRADVLLILEAKDILIGPNKMGFSAPPTTDRLRPCMLADQITGGAVAQPCVLKQPLA